MNDNQVKWAETHDWFSHVEDDNDGEKTICCVDVQVMVDTKEVITCAAFFTDFNELKVWAGY